MIHFILSAPIFKSFSEYFHEVYKVLTSCTGPNNPEGNKCEFAW